MARKPATKITGTIAEGGSGRAPLQWPANRPKRRTVEAARMMPLLSGPSAPPPPKRIAPARTAAIANAGQPSGCPAEPNPNRELIDESERPLHRGAHCAVAEAQGKGFVPVAANSAHQPI